jgi:hypothetical protein
MRELNISSTAASRKDAWRCHLALVIPSEVEESLDASVVRSKIVECHLVLLRAYAAALARIYAICCNRGAR